MNEQKRTGYLPKSAHRIPLRSAIPFVLSRHMPKLLDLCSIGLGHHVTDYQGDTTLHGTVEWRILESRWESEEFTLRGTGLGRIGLSINVFNPNGPSSTGAVELDSSSVLPSASDACCLTTYYSGCAVIVGYTVSLVGCEPGTVIIRLQDSDNDYALIREYIVLGARVSAPLLRSAEYSNEKEAWPTTSGPLPNP